MTVTSKPFSRANAPQPTRRWVLKGLSAAFFAGLLLLNLRQAAPPAAIETLRLKLSSLFSDLPGAMHLGALYLKDRPNAIGQLFSQFRGVTFEDTKTMRKFLVARRADDFAAGRIVVLDGWVLAQCEVQVCAFLNVT